jgi:hypothetical protein
MLYFIFCWKFIDILCWIHQLSRLMCFICFFIQYVRRLNIN